jgi:hypothetical protein
LLFRLAPPCNLFGIPPRAFDGALDFILRMLPLKVRENGIAMRELSCEPCGVVIHACRSGNARNASHAAFQARHSGSVKWA